MILHNPQTKEPFVLLLTMNISLSAAAAKKPKSDPKKKAAAGKPPKTKNVLGDDSSESEEEKATPTNHTTTTTTTTTTRAVVNQALRQEQAALRQRAEKELAAATAAQADIYDYDGAYESFSKTAASSDGKKQTGDKQSRYIGDLLKTAQARKLDRDIAYERKVAKEQKQEEEDNIELRGKERFVTAAYKRKLEERQLWQAAQDKRAALEEDVTQKEGGLSNFYGKFSQNVAMGGAPKAEEEQEVGKEGDNSNIGRDSNQKPPAFLEGFETTPQEDHDTAPNENEASSSAKPAPNHKLALPEESSTTDPEVERQKRRRLREEKLAQARIRYLERHGLVEATSNNNNNNNQ